MKSLFCLLASTAIVAAVTMTNAAEPSQIRQVSANTQKALKAPAKATGPRLFSQALIASSTSGPVPPAPAADGETYYPTGPHNTSGAPLPAAEPMPAGIPEAAEAVTLYDCVKYEDIDNAHPCAVRKIVAVLDPNTDMACSCGPTCVYVEICVPPCGCPDVRVTRGGRKVVYDYGKFEIEIKSYKGVVHVDYDNGILNHY